MKESRKGIQITRVTPNSIADELGVDPGDLLVSVQNQLPRDYVEFLYLTSDDELEILIQKPDGEEWLLDVEREPGEELGLQLDGIIYDELKECGNHCMFCFVHQMPDGMRPTLSFKDDDYRFSFLQGSFITLTNLLDEELERIKTFKLTPLYVSVHTTNPMLRQRMMGNKRAGQIMEQLRGLKEAGIDFHAQIVLCPGVNDRDELKRSIEDLATLRPNLLSLAIVPVGLTRYREKLYPLTTISEKEAEAVFGMVTDYQKRFAQEDENFVYLSDEFYLLTGHSFPEREAYHGFPQLENGIGLSRLFLDEFQDLESVLPKKMTNPAKVLMVTGRLGEKVLQGPIDRLRSVEGLTVEVLTVVNRFFGEKVTVAGLLTGEDLLRAIQEIGPEEYDLILLPQIVLNDNDLFIDGMSQDEFVAILDNVRFIDHFNQMVDELVDMNLMEVRCK